MIRLRTASALAAGAVAALALGGTAMAAGSDDTSGPAVLAAPAPSASTDSPAPSSSVPSSADPSSSASSAPAAADAVSLDAAKEIAIKAAGGGQVTDSERETEHGRAVWDIEVQAGTVEHDIDVDRATGEVLRHESETDDDGHDSDDSDDSDDGSDD
jgi:uncharacterized membrane protein YkoI